METQDSVLDVVHPIQQSSIENHRALFSHDPEQAFLEAQRIVNVVAKRCNGPGYIALIGNKTYPTVSWWTAVGASLGLFAQVIYARRLEREDEIAYESRVEIHRNGHIVASAESICSSKEERWATAEEYAIKSMSSTRAAGKCFRLALSFIAVLAGLEATPAEEMPMEDHLTPVRSDESSNPQKSRLTNPTPTRIVDHDDEAATEKQVATIRNLVDNPKVYPAEKRQIHEWLEDGRAQGIGLSRSKAKEILDYYFGISVLVDGKWSKSGNGKLAERR
jgi:hypothetical protein